MPCYCILTNPAGMQGVRSLTGNLNAAGIFAARALAARHRKSPGTPPTSIVGRHPGDAGPTTLVGDAAQMDICRSVIHRPHGAPRIVWRVPNDRVVPPRTGGCMLWSLSPTPGTRRIAGAFVSTFRLIRSCRRRIPSRVSADEGLNGVLGGELSGVSVQGQRWRVWLLISRRALVCAHFLTNCTPIASKISVTIVIL